MDNISENSEKLLQQLLSLLSSTKKIKTGSTKQNSGQTNTGIVLGDMINGISEEALSGWFAELRGQIQRNSDYMTEAVTNAIDSVLVSKVAKMVAEAYHTHCLSDTSEKEELELTLRDIQNKAGSITTEIQAVIKECNDTKEEVDELVKRLTSLNEEIKAELGNIFDLCEKILSEIRFANERIGKLTTLAKENKDAIADLKKIVLSYIQLSEKHHEESQLILTTMQDNKLSSPGLDEQTIVAMRVWFDKISQDLSNNSKDQKEIIESITNQRKNLEDKLTEVQKSITKLGELINKYGTENGKKLEDINETLSQKAKEILQRGVEIYDLALDTNQTTHQTYEITQEILDCVKGIRAPVANLEKISREVLQNTKGPEKEKLNEKICELQQIANKLELQLQIAAQEGEAVEEACPYCGYVELRGIGGGKCQCDCCGNTFTPTSESRENDGAKKQTTEEQEKAVEIWRKKHTAILENVANDGKDSEKHYLCRMKLKGDTVSSKGVLIIPSPPKASKEEWFGDIPTSSDGKIRLAFCQPNIDDEVSWERMRRIKTLILPSNMILTKFNDAFPFSKGIDDIEKVLQFDEKEKKCTEDKETLKQIKKESV